MAPRLGFSTPAAVLFVVWLCSAVHLVPLAQAIWLTIPKSGTKCVSEDMQTNVVVLAVYYVIGAVEGDQSYEELPPVSVKVTSPYGNTLYHKENVTNDQIAFTTSEAGNYLACFWLDNKEQQNADITLGLDWKIGIAARDWESVAKKEKIEGVELDLRRLEARVQAIHENIVYLKHREIEMREVSEKTNARVARFSIMSLGVCIVTSVWQLWHLKRFFRKKKLI